MINNISTPKTQTIRTVSSHKKPNQVTQVSLSSNDEAYINKVNKNFNKNVRNVEEKLTYTLEWLYPKFLEHSRKLFTLRVSLATVTIFAFGVAQWRWFL